MNDDDFDSSKSYDIEKIDNLYTDDIVQSIATKYGFDASETNFRWWVTKAAAWRLKYLRTHPKAPTPAQQRKIAERLLKHTDALTQGLSEEGLDLIAFAMDDAAKQLGISHPPTKTKNGHFDLICKHYNDLCQGLSILSLTLKMETEHQQNDKGGRPKNHGLQQFCGYIADFCEQQLQRRFTLDHHKGAGLTRSYELVLDCLEPIGGAPEREIVSAMRFVIAERGAHENRPKTALGF